MKKLIWFASVCQFIFITTLVAQENTAKKKTEENIVFPAKPFRIALVAEGNFNSSDYPGRYGVSGAGKFFMRAQKNGDAYNEYVVTLRASHSPATDGSFFKGFDGGNYNNISAIMLMGGYRFNFGIPRYMIHHFTDDVGGWFIEVNGGVSYTHFSRTWAPVVSPVIGYAVMPKFDIVTSFLGSWALQKDVREEGKPFSKKTSIFINGIGIQYTF